MNISSVVPSSDTATNTMADFEKVDPVRKSSANTCFFWLRSGAYTRSFWIGIFHIGNFCFWVPFLKQLLLRNCAVDFVQSQVTPLNYNRLSRRTATRSHTRPVCNKGITLFACHPHTDHSCLYSPVARQPPFDRYQVILLGDRGT